MHTLQITSSVLSGTSNFPLGQGHGMVNSPNTTVVAVQRPDMTSREGEGVARCFDIPLAPTFSDDKWPFGCDMF